MEKRLSNWVVSESGVSDLSGSEAPVVVDWSLTKRLMKLMALSAVG